MAVYACRLSNVGRQVKTPQLGRFFVVDYFVRVPNRLGSQFYNEESSGYRLVVSGRYWVRAAILSAS